MLKIHKAICVGLGNQFSILIVKINIPYKLVIVYVIEISSIQILFKKQIKLLVIFRHKLKLF